MSLAETCVCSIATCTRSYYSLNFCRHHYRAFKKWGDPLRRQPSTRDRLLARTFVNEDGCWIWTGQLNNFGYGLIWYEGSKTSAHRASYETFVGAIPEGLQVDHLCSVRACIRPSHLEPVTKAENLRRRDERQAQLRQERRSA